jgi:hypothetical protein
VAHLDGRVERVTIPAPLPGLGHVPARNEVGDDPLRSALRDPDGFGDIAQPNVGIALKAQEDLRVARQELPACVFRI